MKRIPWELAALPALGVAHLLPASGAGLWVRLAAATACLLLPGALVARAIGRPSVSGALAWSLASLFAASAIMFAARGSLGLALGLDAAVAAAALPVALGRRAGLPRRDVLAVGAAGVALGAALWHVAGALDGDALFHLARVRKLEAFDGLSLGSLNEFRDGGLHPGYAFPLWHVLLALVARLGGLDPGSVLLHEASVLVPVALVVAYEAGKAVFRSAWAGAAVVLAQVSLIALAPGHGGAYTALALPATAARQLLVPAVFALFFHLVREPSAGLACSLAAAGLALVLVHPTYAVFVAIPLGGFVVARALLARTDVARGLAGLAALAAPTAAVSAWLYPLVRETASHDPSLAERARGIRHYAGQLDVFSETSFRLTPSLFGRAGAVAIAALALVPLAALAPRRRWAALVLGGTLAVMGLTLIPELFTRFSDAVSLSQARRAAGFVPFAFAVAGGAAVLARLLSWAVLPVALGAGIALQLVYPGEFGYFLKEGGPAAVTWTAAIGGAAVLVGASILRRPASLEAHGPLAAAATALFVLPVAVHGFANWSPPDRAVRELTPGLVRALRAVVPEGDVVYSDDATSYRIAAALPVYVAVAPPGHVADTSKNRPYERRDDSLLFFRTGDLTIPRRYGAEWLVVDRRRWRTPLKRPVVYEDAWYTLYRL